VEQGLWTCCHYHFASIGKHLLPSQSESPSAAIQRQVTLRGSIGKPKLKSRRIMVDATSELGLA
jgi:hypothetical protein